jgi:peptidoglycan hydrolase CwlO-like protein
MGIELLLVLCMTGNLNMSKPQSEPSGFTELKCKVEAHDKELTDLRSDVKDIQKDVTGIKDSTKKISGDMGDVKSTLIKLVNVISPATGNRVTP